MVVLRATQLTLSFSESNCVTQGFPRIVPVDRNGRRRNGNAWRRGQVSNSSTASRIRRTSFAPNAMVAMDFWRSENRVYGLVVAREEAGEDAWRRRGAVGVSDSMCSGRGPTRKRYTASPEYLWHIRTSSDIYTSGVARNARTAIPNNCFWKCELRSYYNQPDTIFHRLRGALSWRKTGCAVYSKQSARLNAD